MAAAIERSLGRRWAGSLSWRRRSDRHQMLAARCAGVRWSCRRRPAAVSEANEAVVGRRSVDFCRHSGRRAAGAVPSRLVTALPRHGDFRTQLGPWTPLALAEQIFSRKWS